MRIEDFFAGYAHQMNPALIAQQQGVFQRSISLIPSVNSSHNAYVLSLLEKGRLAFQQNNWLESQQYFQSAHKLITKEEEKAKIQLSNSLQSVGSLVSNDSAIQYLIPAYEQTMLHSYQALNYTYQENIEAALVEIRRANLVQEQALLNNEALIHQAYDEMEMQGLDQTALSSTHPNTASPMNDVKNGFQNAFTFYLSGLLYETTGYINDAYIDYKKALEIFPSNVYLKQDVYRLAQQLNMDDDLQKISNVNLNKLSLGEEDDLGQVVIIYEQNVVNKKYASALSLPIETSKGDLRFYSFSLPAYRPTKSSQPLYLHFDNHVFQSEKIVELQSLASKQLSDELPFIYARQAARIVVKEKFREKMSKEGGDVGNILASIYNITSEQADTRSWLTLPSNIQILKLSLPVGKHALTLEHSNGTTIEHVNVQLNRTTLVSLNTVGSFSGVKTINL